MYFNEKHTGERSSKKGNEQFEVERWFLLLRSLTSLAELIQSNNWGEEGRKEGRGQDIGGQDSHRGAAWTRYHD